jgi:CRP-like cAMP-binding protein
VELAEIADRLRQQPIFSAWPPALLDMLLPSTRMEDWEDGAILFMEKSPASDFFWLESGVVELVSSSADGKEKIVEIMQAGDLFAEGVAFMGGRYPVTARCSGAVRILRIPFAPVITTLDANAQLMRRILAQLSMRLHFLVKELRQHSVQSADARVANYLLDLAQSEEARQGWVSLPAKKATVAARIGITPETLSRVLRRLREARVITIEGRNLHILDSNALQRWSCS